MERMVQISFSSTEDEYERLFDALGTFVIGGGPALSEPQLETLGRFLASLHRVLETAPVDGNGDIQ